MSRRVKKDRMYDCGIKRLNTISCVATQLTRNHMGKRGHGWERKTAKTKVTKVEELPAETPEAELERLRSFWNALMQPVVVRGAVYNLQQHEQKILLAKDIWLAAKPWLEVAALLARQGKDSPQNVVREYVVRLTPYFNWQL